jgi:hypothetical protein
MATKIIISPMLQEFLNHNFIQITEDTNFDKLKKACDEIIKKISKNKTKIITYTLIAFDPEISVENADIKEVREIIIKHWSTFLANTKDTPVTFIRAVILEALESVSKDINLASLVWHSGRNVIKYYKIGREKDLLSDFLLQLGNRVENEAIKRWSLQNSEQKKGMPNVQFEMKDVKEVKIDSVELEKKLKAATNYTGWGGENPSYPHAGSQAWGDFFTSRGAKGIAETINKALAEQASALSTNKSSILQGLIHLAEIVNQIVGSAQEEILEKNHLINMRTQLLWWKEALYSNSLRTSYRELNLGILEVVLANDYSNQIPFIYPASVDYFLKETHNNLISHNENKVKISDILISIDSEKEVLKELFKPTPLDGNRISFLNFIAGLILNVYGRDKFSELVGISDTTEITLSEFILWIFQDAQALKVITIK